MFALLLIAALLFPARPAGAAIYKYVEPDGTIHFTDTPASGAVKVANDRRAEVRAAAAGRQPSGPVLSHSEIEGIIKSKSKKYQVDPSLVKAVIRAESGFNCSAVSRKGAMGLMQLMPSTAVSMGVYDPFDPEQNIEGGIRYLSDLLGRFGGNLTLALAAYNAGPKYIEKYGSIPPYRETGDYIRKILASYRGGAFCSPAAGYRPRGGKTSARRKERKTEIIYRIALRDGTVLYTNNPPGF